jgi:hypothetical protein
MLSCKCADQLAPRVREVFDAWVELNGAADRSRHAAYSVYRDLLIRLSDEEQHQLFVTAMAHVNQKDCAGIR